MFYVQTGDNSFLNIANLTFFLSLKYNFISNITRFENPYREPFFITII
jgi:hypothetical protein